MKRIDFLKNIAGLAVLPLISTIPTFKPKNELEWLIDLVKSSKSECSPRGQYNFWCSCPQPGDPNYGFYANIILSKDEKDVLYRLNDETGVSLTEWYIHKRDLFNLVFKRVEAHEEKRLEMYKNLYKS